MRPQKPASGVSAAFVLPGRLFCAYLIDLTPVPSPSKGEGRGLHSQVLRFCLISPHPRPFSLQGRRGKRSQLCLSPPPILGEGIKEIGPLPSAAAWIARRRPEPWQGRPLQ